MNHKWTTEGLTYGAAGRCARCGLLRGRKQSQRGGLTWIYRTRDMNKWHRTAMTMPKCEAPAVNGGAS